ncbi:hypothetical protein [Paraburkholderia sp. D1E]
MRGSITEGCHPRCIYLSRGRTIDAFGSYIEWRYQPDAGAAL